MTQQQQASSVTSILQHGLQAGKTRIGWIGTGVMGISMVQHVMRAAITSTPDGAPQQQQAAADAGKLYPTSIYTRTAGKAQPALDAGATLVQSVAEVGSNSDIVFTMVGYPSDVRAVYYGFVDESGQRVPGLLDTLARGSVVVDMTTSEPSLAQEIAHDAAARGIYALDAPVSGGDVGAKEAKLSIMVGGEIEVMYAVLPLFQAMGKNITYKYVVAST